MSLNLESYGLDFLLDEEELFMGFVASIVEQGKAILGYYNTPYIFKSFGDAEFFVRTKNGDGDTLSFDGIDAHCGNECVWELRYTGIDITPEEDSRLKKNAVFSSLDPDDGGFVPVEIINSDVLPGLMEDDSVTLQITAQALDISYYENEEQYADSVPEVANGCKYLVADGSLLALSFITNHSTETYIKDEAYPTDSHIHFAGTVKKLYSGSFGFDNDKSFTFIRCFIDTAFGELEIDHAYEQVPEELRGNIRVGAHVSGVLVLSGDAAIDKYENGIIKDHDNALKLMRYTLANGEAERLRSILDKNAEYLSEASETKLNGAEDIINRINYVNSIRESKYIVHLTEISHTEEEGTEYPAGTRCLVLEDSSDKSYESIVFITVNDEGNITKLHFVTDSRYHFFTPWK